MKDSIFRKESLERISSPRELNQYIRVADSGTWLMLAAIVLLLLGVMVWGIFGTIEDSVPACIAADETGVVCYVSQQDAVRMGTGMRVRIDGKEGVIVEVSQQIEILPQEVQDVLSLGSGCVAYAEFEEEVQGVHAAEVIVEKITPISFVLQ